MNFQRPDLDTSISCRRELLVSLGSSVALIAALCGVLALVTLTISEVLDLNETWSEPLTVEHSEIEEIREEPVEEVEFQALPSSALPVAPLAVMVPVASVAAPPLESPVPEVEAPPVMDDLAWSEEPFEPWINEKKPVTRSVVAKKSPPPPPPRPKAVPRSSPKPARVNATPARVVSRSTPSYPGSARRSGKEGRVVVTVSISASGKIVNAFISVSSRNSSLDSAALSAAKKYRFAPARNTTGTAVASKVALPFTFKLS